jgi:acyl-CoA synthetase (AMP-forming)/AMP-acid ligase II
MPMQPERSPSPQIPSFDSLAGALRYWAKHAPEQLAFRFLVDGESEEDVWSYAKLDRAARSIAASLRAMNAAGQRALLLYPPGPDYVAAFYGCLYAGVIAVPAYPPDPSRLTRTLPRLRAIISDCCATVTLTTEPIREIAEALLADVRTRNAAPMRWLATDTLPERGADSPLASPDPARIAFLQYTSGSTSAPRGVMVTHGNLLHNIGQLARRVSPVSQMSSVSWVPPYHDMGLIGGILTPVYIGRPVTLMSPLDFLQRPVRWLAALSKYQASSSMAPNFAYDLCVRKVTPAQRAGLDLSHWKATFDGAEPIDASVIERFVAAFGPAGFRREVFVPCYGLAESTLIATSVEPGELPTVRLFNKDALARNLIEAANTDEPSRTLVGSGYAIDGHKIEIVDPETRRRCPPGQIGEIWLRGPSIAQGYWNRPEETQVTFKAQIANDSSGPFLRTGDLGVLVDGELFVTGRLKDLIILAGMNHYPQDIERTVEASHPSVRAGTSAAFAAPVEDRERLVVACETEAPHSPREADALRNTIHRAVVEGHDLPPHSILLLRKGAVPRTSSGKIQRHVCREGFLTGTLETHDF